MKVFKGNITKNIPIEFWEGFDLMRPEDFDQPNKIRLSPWERFRMSMYMWEQAQTSSTMQYLAGYEPECVVRQYNRAMECRYVVRYSGEPDADDIKHAIVPKRVGKLCPVILDDYVNWMA